jgi:NADPH:quinone reductase-like Zn-dependent oxidoreductase
VQAALYDRFGPPSVLRIGEAPDPTPGPDELVVAVRAAALNPKDVLVRKGKFRWLSGKHFPRGTGYDFAGEVIAVGPEVVDQRIGDLVYGMLNGWRGATVAERVRVRADECAPLPPLSFEEAAAIPLAAQTALQALRDLGRVSNGHRVVILGASGGVGVFAVQLACALGAEVTAVASAANHPLLRELGAHHVVDYRAEDPLERGPFELVFDVFGNRRFDEAEPALADRGLFVSTVPSRAIFLARLRSLGRPRQARLVWVRSRRADLVTLAGLVERGRLRPVMDSIYPFREIAAAHAKIETKRSRGKVVVRIATD